MRQPRIESLFGSPFNTLHYLKNFWNFWWHEIETYHSPSAYYLLGDRVAKSDFPVQRMLFVVRDQINQTLKLSRANDKQASFLLDSTVFDFLLGPIETYRNNNYQSGSFVMKGRKNLVAVTYRNEMEKQFCSLSLGRTKNAPSLGYQRSSSSALARTVRGWYQSLDSWLLGWGTGLFRVILNPCRKATF